MLDSFPFGGHTSASDFLIAQVPILTQTGKSFHTRIAGDMLNTLELNEFIVNTNEQYEQKAISCYEGTVDLQEVRSYLKKAIYESSIFNTKEYSISLAELLLQ